MYTIPEDSLPHTDVIQEEYNISQPVLGFRWFCLSPRSLEDIRQRTASSNYRDVCRTTLNKHQHHCVKLSRKELLVSMPPLPHQSRSLSHHLHYHTATELSMLCVEYNQGLNTCLTHNHQPHTRLTRLQTKGFALLGSPF